MARKIDSKEFTTELWPLNIIFKGDKIGVVISKPTGERKIHWSVMSSRMSKAVNTVVQEDLDQKAYDASLTPLQLAEKYEEMMGS